MGAGTSAINLEYNEVLATILRPISTQLSITHDNQTKPAIEEQQRLEQKIQEQENELQRIRERTERLEKEMKEHQEKMEKEKQERQAELEELQKDNEERQEKERKKLEEETWVHIKCVEKEREADRLERLEAAFKQYKKKQKAAQKELKRRHEEKAELLQAHVKQLEKGISPKVWPSDQEWIQARGRLLLGGPEKFHCAVAGNSGSGKSSLIDALRGVSNRNEAAAAVGVTETIQEITPYPDPHMAPPHNKFIWYDIPGAGTLSIPGPQYFNSQGLFVFDMIIVVVDTRLTALDIAILQSCEYFKIPSFIVRSKVNQDIENIIQQELAFEDDLELSDEDDAELKALKEAKRFEVVKRQLVSEARKSYRKSLMEAGELNPDQKVYFVSADGVRSLVALETQKGLRRFKNGKYLIDELELLRDLLETIIARKSA